MDPSIRPVEPGPSAPAPLRRRQGEGKPFDLERELERRDEEPPADEEGARREREPTPVAPPDDDEAGGRIDLTA
jgi:hypothetical protein